MTKREKIAISISAIIGFAVFCIALAPIWFLLGYLFGDHTCFVRVEYKELPYAMGEDYVYVSSTFWDELDYKLKDSVSIMYSGKWGKYNDSNFETPIPKTWNYHAGFEKQLGDECFSNINVACSKVNMKNYDESSYDCIYGKYKYNVDSQIERDGEGNYGYYLDYNVCAVAESGIICDFSITIYGFELLDEPFKDSIKDGFKYHRVFEGMLDNLVGYSYFIIQ